MSSLKIDNNFHSLPIPMGIDMDYSIWLSLPLKSWRRDSSWLASGWLRFIVF
jgi:hypothetical protein